MLFLTCVVLFASIGANLAQNPPTCCVAREFEADLGVIGSTFSRRHHHREFNQIEGFSTVKYDHHSQIIAIKTSTVVHSAISVSNIILDYKGKREYVVINGNCTVYELNIPMRDPCIPDNAKFLRESIYGYGSNSLSANSWRYKDKQTGADTTIAVTKDGGCIPLVITQYNKHAAFSGNRQELVLIYSNFHASVKDRSVFFAVPKSCDSKNVKPAITLVSPL